MNGLPARVREHGNKRAIIDPAGAWSYAALADDAAALASALRGDRDDRDNARIVLLCEPGHDYVVALLACWDAGGIAVPLHPAHPLTELAYYVGDSKASVVMCSRPHRERASRLAAHVGAKVVTVDAPASPQTATTSGVDTRRAALMIYTSGTTGRPKGVVHTHASVQAQVESLVDAWAWSDDDRILLVMPLHHVHGIVNVTLCALFAGATCESPGGFDARQTWERLASSELTLFMAVPTIYTRLIRGMGGRERERPAALVHGRGSCPTHGVGLGRAPGFDACSLGGAHGSGAARALRNDRGRHDALEHARAPGAGQGG